MSQALHPMLNIAIKAARSAGAIINRASLDLDLLKISTKGPNDFVSEVDQAAEQAIIDILLEAYPGHGILAEESGSQHGAKDSEFVWIIDPLDGTTNFIHGFPVYCVSIALAVRGKIEQAVIYDPTRNDLFTATKGRGAYMNDRRIRVSKRTDMRMALIACGLPIQNWKGRAMGFTEQMERVADECGGLRRLGVASLDLAYVAAGRLDPRCVTALLERLGQLGAEFTRQGPEIFDLHAIDLVAGVSQPDSQHPFHVSFLSAACLAASLAFTSKTSPRLPTSAISMPAKAHRGASRSARRKVPSVSGTTAT